MEKDIRQINEILTYLRQKGIHEIERLDIEIKSANVLDAKSSYGCLIAKAIMALANHGGGILVIGYRKNNGKYVEEEIKDEVLHTWEQTRLHDLLERYSDPVPNVKLYNSKIKSNVSSHPAIKVTTHGKSPVICKRDGDGIRAGAVYIRRPGPKTEEPQNSTEWQELLRRCLLSDREDLSSMFRSILLPPSVEKRAESDEENLNKQVSLADKRFIELLKDHQDEIKNMNTEGRWVIAYQLLPVPKQNSLRDLKDILEKSQINMNWPIGVILHNRCQPYVYNNALEAWVTSTFSDLHLDYWCATRTGFFYATRNYKDDIQETRDDRFFEYQKPIKHIGEAVLHALQFSKLCGSKEVERIQFYVRYQDLSNCMLLDLNSMILGVDYKYRDTKNEKICRVSEWKNQISLPVSLDVVNLPEVVGDLLDSLYEHFDLFKVPKEEYEIEIHEMLKKYNWKAQ